MAKKPIKHNCRYRKSAGVISILFAGIAAVLVGVLGISMYVGISAYIHGEMHEAANTAAGSAARALYDDIGENFIPVRNVDLALSAGNAAFDLFIASNSFLNEHLSPSIEIVANGPNQITATTTGTLQTPLLSVIGVNELAFEAQSTAQYAQNEHGGICDLEGNSSEKASCINTQVGPFSRLVALDLPLYDGDGMDLYINTGSTGTGYHGIMIEICTSEIKDGETIINEGACKPVKMGAVPYQEGAVVVRGDNHVLYGQIFIDLEADGIEKGTAIKIIDDGVHDAYEIENPNELGARWLEVAPQLTLPTSIRTLHHAILCKGDSCNDIGSDRLLTADTPEYT